MYSASIENRGGSKSFVTTKDYSFVIDTEGEGANPVDTVLSGLCGCLAHYTRDYIRQEKMSADGFDIRAEAGLTEGREKLARIDVTISMKNGGLSDRQREGLRETAKRCLVYNTLKEGCAIDIEVA